MDKFVMSIETVKIKDFIFSTNKLRVIRGASYLLDDLNQNEVREILKKHVKEDQIIYIGAGNAKFFVPSEEVAQKVKDEVTRVYEEKAPGVKLAIAWKERNDKVWNIMDELAKEVAIQKSRGFSNLNIDMPFVKKCELCGSEAAETIFDDVKICGCCDKKIKAAKTASFSMKGVSSKEAKIEDYEGDKSFIGFIYSDGDGLGDFLKNIGDKFKKSGSEESYIKFLKEFSETLDRNTKAALEEAVNELPEKDRKAEFLIVGGDDVCAVFKPDVALEVSANFQKKFEEKMLEYTKAQGVKDRITSSSGVIIAKSKTPMFHLFEQALKLQKSAKAKRHSTGLNTTGFIDFQVIGSEGCVDVLEFRKNISPEENPVIKRPYSIDEDTKGNLKELVTLIKKLKKANFPKTKLRYLYDLKRDTSLEEFEKKMEFINILSKMSKDNIKLVRDEFDIDCDNYNTFNKVFTNIFDILEMYDFVIGGEASEN